MLANCECDERIWVALCLVEIWNGKLSLLAGGETAWLELTILILIWQLSFLAFDLLSSGLR